MVIAADYPFLDVLFAQAARLGLGAELTLLGFGLPGSGLGLLRRLRRAAGIGHLVSVGRAARLAQTPRARTLAARG
jgi:hypothetical protein